MSVAMAQVEAMQGFGLPASESEAERAYVGAVLADSETIARTRQIVRPEDFESERLATILRAATKIDEAGGAVDVVTIATDLEAAGLIEKLGGRAGLLELAEEGLPANAAYHASLVRQASDRRRIRREALAVAEAAADPASDPQDVVHKAWSIEGPLSAAAPVLEAVGLGYRVSFPGSGVEMSIARLRERSGELHGELVVTLRREAADFAAGSLSRGSFNFSSTAARKSLATYLGNRWRGDWAEMLEDACQLLLATKRRGEPFAEVGREPKQATTPKLLEPVLLRDAPAILFGPGGTGKSTLASAIAVSVAAGVEIVPGWLPAEPAPVLYLDWEGTRAACNDRLAAICRGAEIDPPNGVYYRRCSGSLADQVEEIAAFVAEREIGLLLVDSVGLAAGTAREGGDAAESAFRLFEALRAIGRTALLIDHVAGAELNGSAPTSKPYGSVFKVNLARNVFELRREGDPQVGRAEVLMLHTKANEEAKLPPRGIVFTYSEDAITFARGEIEAPDLEGRLSASERMRRALARGPLSESVLAEELGISSSTVRQNLRRHAERFTRLSDGRIALATVTVP